MSAELMRYAKAVRVVIRTIATFTQPGLPVMFQAYKDMLLTLKVILLHGDNCCYHSTGTKLAARHWHMTCHLLQGHSQDM